MNERCNERVGLASRVVALIQHSHTYTHTYISRVLFDMTEQTLGSRSDLLTTFLDGTRIVGIFPTYKE